MGKKMKAAIMNGKRDVAIGEIDKPIPQNNEVLVKIEAVGICGSDLHYYSVGKIGDLLVKTPFILGHECAGTIVEVGPGVDNLAAGDRVALEPGLPCGTCEFCKNGKYNICPEVRFLATPPVDGSFVDYIAYPSNWVFKLPANMDAIEGALIEPLAVGIHAANQAEAGIGQSAFIFGCGCIGLVTLLALRSKGVTDIYMCDLIESRIKKAEELGATKVFNVKESNVVEEIRKITNGKGVAMVFEMTGAKTAVQQTVKLVKKGGKIVLVGLGEDSNITFDFAGLIWNEAEIKTVFRYRNIYPTAITAISSGMIPVKKIVSHRYKMADISKALEYHVENKSEIIKMIIEM